MKKSTSTGKPFFSLLVWTLTASGALAYAADIPLPVIKVTGSATDALLDDPILPVTEKKLETSPGSGSNLREIEGSTVLPVTDDGTTGSLNQVRGIGRSAEDTNVQALGVPLNLPQGGGFDFSSFPSFLWSGYRFQSGPSPGAFDPRALSGTMTLRPWTSEALAGPESNLRFRQLVSDSGLRQISAGAVKSGRVAVLAGYSDDKVVGPSGGFSASLYSSDRTQVRIHALATSVQTNPIGSISFPTPLATQKAARLIPVIEVNHASGDGSEMRGALFDDEGVLRFDDPGHATHTLTHSRQTGAQWVWMSEGWKTGLEARRMSFQQLDFAAPVESSVDLSLSRKIEWSAWTLEPSVRGVGVTRFGIYPEGSLGLRRTLSPSTAAYMKGAYSRKFPAMIDRYFSSPPFFIANPDLRPERDLTGVLGVELKQETVTGTLEVIHQERDNVMILQSVGPPADNVTTVNNFGSAWVDSVKAETVWSSGTHWEIAEGTLFSHSLVRRTRIAFPYLPTWTQSGSARFKPADSWWLQASGRVLSYGVADNTGTFLAGYAFADLAAAWEAFAGWHFGLRVDDLLDRRYEAILGFPSEGRVFAVTVEAVL